MSRLLRDGADRWWPNAGSNEPWPSLYRHRVAAIDGREDDVPAIAGAPELAHVLFGGRRHQRGERLRRQRRVVLAPVPLPESLTGIVPQSSKTSSGGSEGPITGPPIPQKLRKTAWETQAKNSNPSLSATVS